MSRKHHLSTQLARLTPASLDGLRRRQLLPAHLSPGRFGRGSGGIQANFSNLIPGMTSSSLKPANFARAHPATFQSDSKAQQRAAGADQSLCACSSQRTAPSAGFICDHQCPSTGEHFLQGLQTLSSLQGRKKAAGFSRSCFSTSSGRKQWAKRT